MEEGTYSSPEAQRAGGAKKAPRVKFQRKIGLAAGAEPRYYEITDEPPAMNDTNGWKRVLAVFVQGKDWQFRGWPFQVCQILTQAGFCGLHRVCACTPVTDGG